jgi:DNA invertase Pin-like site-specific DNA recombinase
MKIGYARVSTQDQNLDLQLDDLKKAGCEKVYQEKLSGANKQRPVLIDLLDRLRPNDTLIVWKLDRLSRSLRDLIDLVTLLQEKKVGFISLNDSIDTTTAQGRLIFNLFAALSEFERDVIRERTRAGLSAARARGKVGGRPKGLSKEAMSKASAAKTLYDQKDKTVNEIATILGIGRATVYRYLERHK